MKFQYSLKKPDLTIGAIDIQEVSRPKGYKRAFRNGRGSNGFIFTVSGKMCNLLLNEEQELVSSAGELVFMPAGTVYEGRYVEENTRVKIVQFDLSTGELPEYLSKPVKIDLPDAGELIDSFFLKESQSLFDNPFYSMSCLYKLLWKIDEAYLKLPTKYKKLKPALRKMAESNYANKSVRHYAELCDMSEVNFRRLFREYTGLSPIEYRNNIRLDSAKAKLQSGEYNVSEAAEASGFTNLSFFIRQYKRKFGYTPKKE